MTTAANTVAVPMVTTARDSIKDETNSSSLKGQQVVSEGCTGLTGATNKENCSQLKSAEPEGNEPLNKLAKQRSPSPTSSINSDSGRSASGVSSD